MDWLGQQGLGATMTCRRDRLPPEIESKYLCKEKTEAKTIISRVARFNNPITIVKNVEDGDHPTHCKLPGDSKMRVNTQKSKKTVKKCTRVKPKTTAVRVTPAQYKKAKNGMRQRTTINFADFTQTFSQFSHYKG